jgi:hypothetical protein
MLRKIYRNNIIFNIKSYSNNSYSLLKSNKYNQYKNVNISYYLISNHYMNHTSTYVKHYRISVDVRLLSYLHNSFNNINKNSCFISQSYTTSSVYGGVRRDDGIVQDDAVKKLRKDINWVRDTDRPVVKIIQPTTTTTTTQPQQMILKKSKEQKAAIATTVSSSSSSVLAHLTNQSISDTRDTFDKLHRHASDLKVLSETTGSTGSHQRKAEKKNVAMASFDRRSDAALEANEKYNGNKYTLLNTAILCIIQQPSLCQQQEQNIFLSSSDHLMNFLALQ